MARDAQVAPLISNETLRRLHLPATGGGPPKEDLAVEDATHARPILSADLIATYAVGARASQHRDSRVLASRPAWFEPILVRA